MAGEGYVSVQRVFKGAGCRLGVLEVLVGACWCLYRHKMGVKKIVGDGMKWF